jgi:hypothetical protein
MLLYTVMENMIVMGLERIGLVWSSKQKKIIAYLPFFHEFRLCAVVLPKTIKKILDTLTHNYVVQTKLLYSLCYGVLDNRKI